MAGAELFFDDERILVVGLTSSHEGAGHPDHIIELPVDATDQQLVDATREVWGTIEISSVPLADIKRQWYRVSDRFGYEHKQIKGGRPYLQIKAVSVNSVFRLPPLDPCVVVVPTKRRGSIRTSIDDGQSKFPADVSDELLGSAIRKAMNATKN